MNRKQLLSGFIAYKLICLISISMYPFNWGMAAGNSQQQIFHGGSKGEILLRVSDYKLKYSGYITLTDNDKDIVSISPNGYIEIEKVVFGSIRKLKISSNAKGNLTKSYFEGREEKPYDKNGKQWLGDILPDIVKSTGVGAEYRVGRIFKNGGIDGLLDEIKEVDRHNKAARNLYFVIMIDKLKLSEGDLRKAIPEMQMIKSNSTKGTIMREILYKYQLSEENTVLLLETTGTLSYNTERGSTLRVYNNIFKEEDKIIEAYFRIIEDMGINSEKGNVLKDLMQKNKLKSSTYKRLFKSIESFSLTREQGAILLAAIDYMPLEEDLLKVFSETVGKLDNHYYVLKGEIMNYLLESQFNKGDELNVPGKNEFVIQMLNSARNIESNSQKGLTLRKVNKMKPLGQATLFAYKDVLNSVSDKIERYNILLDFINHTKINNEGIEMVLDATEDLVSSDYQHGAGAVLRALIDHLPNDEAIIDSFFDIIDKMDQNSTIEEILRLVNAKENLSNSEQVIIRSIEATKKISVDLEIATVLYNLNNYNNKSKSQSIVYEYQAKEIKSDYLRRKVMDR